MFVELSFTQEVVRGTVHQFLDAANSLKMVEANGGCRVQGVVKTDKVAGNFRFKVNPRGTGEHNQFQFQAPVSAEALYPNLDLSHEVKNIFFEGKHDLVAKLMGLASPPTPLKSQTTRLDSGKNCRMRLLLHYQCGPLYNFVLSRYFCLCVIQTPASITMACKLSPQ